MKTALKAKSREGHAIRATTIFFWFFSHEKEKNEPLQKAALRRAEALFLRMTNHGIAYAYVL
ncbi:hypothetical protein LOH54_11450 [Sulfurimonas sp. HSL-3221]|uniref:hypothetical protein n=1 Tax=Thiomicrolovo sulfuroxydans TaxID=2894755 RepID=UPI001E56254A|nr:hypothetical protein [Sulfurimonas sp. HSL-3221]UFS62255.1 hypothetical protein LOH54_11450 [Sulfurimonas sp. HSL-3221]